MTDKRDEQKTVKDELNQPTSGAGYGNDAEELQKSETPAPGEEKSA